MSGVGPLATRGKGGGTGIPGRPGLVVGGGRLREVRGQGGTPEQGGGAARNCLRGDGRLWTI